MALKILNPGTNPLGQFDCLDGDVASIKGGEVLQFGSVSFDPSVDVGTDDGYVPTPAPQRTVVKLARGNTPVPLMLADEGVAGYGTLFGTVVGASLGRSTSGGVLGPHTATGSGKVTAWDKPGLYAVSVDAVHSALNPTATLSAGQALFFRIDAGNYGKLTVGSGAGTISTTSVGSFVGFETNGSLVNTPNNLLAALNYGSHPVAGGANGSFAYVTFHFNPYG